MCKNYELDKKKKTINIMHIHTKPTENLKLVIYCTKFKTLNLIFKNNTNSATL